VKFKFIRLLVVSDSGWQIADLAKQPDLRYDAQMAVDVVAQMKKFVEPESVAILGVPRSPMAVTGGGALDVLTSLVKQGYQGKIYPIHPRGGKIQGLKAYTSIMEVPENIDLAVINLPRDLVPGLVKECVDKGVKAVTILTQGFADADDDEGKQLQRQIDDFARGTGTRILGPNTLGTANAYINFSSAFMETQMEKNPIGFMCQTGVFFMSIAGLKLMGKAIDLGNGSDIHFSEGLEYLEQDAETEVIGLHIEGMRDSASFLRRARRVARKKPIIALKTGRGEWAARAIQSHTGSLAGGDEIWDAAFKQAGVIRVDDVEEFTDTLRAFYKLAPMKGRRVGVISYTGGFGVMGIEACQKYGLEVARFSPQTISVLGEILPSWQGVGNPADLGPGIMVRKLPAFETLETVVKAILGDPGVDAVLGIFGAFGPSVGAAYYQVAEKAAMSYPDKPFVFYFYGPFVAEAMGEFQAKDGTMIFPSPNRAVRALGHLADYSEFRMKS
jgi:acyl-CoA synthetase (NDP forming)